MKESSKIPNFIPFLFLPMNPLAHEPIICIVLYLNRCLIYTIPIFNRYSRRFEKRKHYKFINYFHKNAWGAPTEDRWNGPFVSWNKIKGKKMRGKLYLCSLSQFQTTVEISLNVTANKYRILGSFAHIRLWWYFYCMKMLRT